jgi:dienelactone hydrolase
MDIRRARQMLETFPEVDRHCIGLVGLSWGAIVGSLAAGVDGKFDKCVFILGGGNLADVIWDSPAASDVKERLLRSGETLPMLQDELKCVEPTQYAARVDPSKALMLNVKDDDWVPRSATTALWEAMGKPEIKWYPGSHLGAALFLHAMVNKAAEFIKK